MSLPQIKLIWGAARQHPGCWWLGLCGRLDRGTIAISLRGLLLWALGLGLAADLAGATVLLYWFDRKPYNFITFADLALPTRWPQLRALRGEGMIREGLDDLRDKNWSSGMIKLEIGLSRDPATTKGRIELAALWLAFNERAKAETVLRDGLQPSYPGHAYLEEVIGAATQGENYALWLEVCDTALAQIAHQPQLDADRQWLVRQKLSALLGAGRAEDALHLAEAEAKSGTQGSVMKEYQVLALLQAGRPAVAVDFLAGWAAQAILPEEKSQVRRLQVRAFREAGRLDDMDHALDAMREANPVAPAAYVYAIIQRLLAGRRAGAEKTLHDFLLRFSSQPANLTLLADPLADIGEEPMIAPLLETARAQGLNLLALQRAQVAAAVKNGHWSAAAATIAAMKPNVPPGDQTAQFWLAYMSDLVAAALDPGDSAQAGLVILMGSRRLSLDLYRDAGDAMERAGRPATARQIVALATRGFPENPRLLATAASLDREIAALPQTALATPTTIAALIATGEKEYFKTLTAAMQAGDLADALAQLRAVRAANPPWLAAHDSELRDDEILLTARQHDLAAMNTAASRLLNGSTARALETVNLATQLHTGDTQTEAVLLVQTILRKYPAYPPAVRLLAAWQPPVPAVGTTSGAPSPNTALPEPLLVPHRPTVAAENPFFTTLAATIAAQDAKGALAQIQTARAANPSWLPGRQDELRRDEILLDARLHDAVAMLTIARVYLIGSIPHAAAAVELANQLHTGDTQPEALLLVQEILRQVPDFPPALHLLNSWPPALGK